MTGTAALREILSSYPRFCTFTVDLHWAEAACILNDDWSSRYPNGCNAYAVRFAEGDVQAHLPERFVQALLMRNADFEGWEPDFWQIPAHERAEWLTNSASDRIRRLGLTFALSLRKLHYSILFGEFLCT